MYRRDYVTKQTEEFAQMLGRLSKASGLNQKEKAWQIINDAYKAFLREEALHIKQYLFLPPDKIQEKFKYTNEQMEFLARLFFEEASIFNEEKYFAEKALLILRYLNFKQKVYSFEREKIIEKIEWFLNES